MGDKPVSTEEYLAVLAKDLLGAQPGDDDLLTLMLLLHTHHIWLPRPLLTDRPGVAEVAALTQHHAAQVAAAAWPDRTDARKSDCEYWEEEFCTRTLYELTADRPEPWLERVERLRSVALAHPLVERMEPED